MASNAMRSTAAPSRERGASPSLSRAGGGPAHLLLSALVCLCYCGAAAQQQQQEQEELLYRYAVVVDWEANPTRQACEQAPGKLASLLGAWKR